MVLSAPVDHCVRARTLHAPFWPETCGAENVGEEASDAWGACLYLGVKRIVDGLDKGRENIDGTEVARGGWCWWSREVSVMHGLVACLNRGLLAYNRGWREGTSPGIRLAIHDYQPPRQLIIDCPRDRAFHAHRLGKAG